MKKVEQHKKNKTTQVMARSALCVPFVFSRFTVVFVQICILVERTVRFLSLLEWF